MGGDYVSLRVDQSPSSGGRDHHFRAVLHHFTAVVFTPEEHCPISHEHRNQLCQVILNEVPQAEDHYCEVENMKKVENTSLIDL